MFQQTIKTEICALGMGLHTGRELTVRLKPAPAGSGLNFMRSDLAGVPALKAVAANVTGTALATTLGQGENTVGTIEHLLSAVGGLGVDNLLVEIDGPELPVFDGSSAEWLRLLNEAGLAAQGAPRHFKAITRPFRLVLGDKSIEARPAGRLSVEGHIDFGGFIGRQSFYFISSPGPYATEISRARTFCLAKDVEMMRSQGLARGGSLANAVVVGDAGLLNPEGLRYRDEFVRHKILDFLGDLVLVGAPVLGHFTLNKPGHDLNCRFVEAILAEAGLLAPVPAEPRKRRPERPKALNFFQDEVWTPA
jgi:UDP-3-O-[3-hydroxymyristoyl] N-acetylglucosamine deacetylase